MDENRSAQPRIEVCPDCDGVSRRRFLDTVGRSAAAVCASGVLGVTSGARLFASPVRAAVSARADRPAETVVKLLYESLKPEQRQVIHFPFDHEKRSFISNNWHVVEPAVGSIGKLYTGDQKELIREIFKGVTSEDGYERFQRQMKDDDGGFENYTCAIFGEPGTGHFEWVLTGRHLTIRADGESVENAAFGGPIFYGHAVKFDEEPDHPGNVWWHQARLANKVFATLDGKQREKALLDKDPPDSAETIDLHLSGRKLVGIPVAELSSDQKGVVEETIRSMLSMYRKSDVDEALACLKENGGLDALRLSFYKEGDLGKDGIWDRWRLEGPAFAWYFRGSPHVHTWVNIAHRGGGDGAAGSASAGASVRTQAEGAVEGARRRVRL